MSDSLRAQATKPMDWNEGSHYCNWRNYVGAPVRAVWHTFTDDQKFAIAVDALERAKDKEYD